MMRWEARDGAGQSAFQFRIQPFLLLLFAPSFKALVSAVQNRKILGRVSAGTRLNCSPGTFLIFPSILPPFSPCHGRVSDKTRVRFCLCSSVSLFIVQSIGRQSEGWFSCLHAICSFPQPHSQTVPIYGYHPLFKPFPMFQFSAAAPSDFLTLNLSIYTAYLPICQSL